MTAFFFFQAEDGIRDHCVTGVQTCALPILGIKGSSTRAVILQDAKVPVENLLGEVGKGAKIAFNILNIGRFKLGAACCGGMKLMITESVRYANERHQFGKPISSFGAIKAK